MVVEDAPEIEAQKRNLSSSAHDMSMVALLRGVYISIAHTGFTMVKKREVLCDLRLNIVKEDSVFPNFMQVKFGREE